MDEQEPETEMDVHKHNREIIESVRTTKIERPKSIGKLPRLKKGI